MTTKMTREAFISQVRERCEPKDRFKSSLHEIIGTAHWLEHHLTTGRTPDFQALAREVIAEIQRHKTRSYTQGYEEGRGEEA